MPRLSAIKACTKRGRPPGGKDVSYWGSVWRVKIAAWHRARVAHRPSVEPLFLSDDSQRLYWARHVSAAQRSAIRAMSKETAENPLRESLLWIERGMIFVERRAL